MKLLDEWTPVYEYDGKMPFYGAEFTHTLKSRSNRTFNRYKMPIK